MLHGEMEKQVNILSDVMQENPFFGSNTCVCMCISSIGGCSFMNGREGLTGSSLEGLKRIMGV